MHILRRDLLKAIGATATLAGCASPTPPPPASPASLEASKGPRAAAAPRPRRILVLGGTGFVGPAIVNAARTRGHAVTLFNRGKTNPGLFPDVETILGDRMTDLERLKGRDWDAVVDTWAPGPTLVRRAAELLRDHVAQYVFVSTISVYKLGKAPLDESSEVLKLPPGLELRDIKKIDEKVYGPLKALAEQAAEETMPGRATSVRPGVIAGPGDPTGRFTYWPSRMARGGEMIAPGAPDDPFQFIDVRDLGAWIVGAIEEKHVGVYDAVGPDEAKLGAVLDAVKRGSGSDVRITWIDAPWLKQNDAGGWSDFPLAVSPDDDESGFARVSAAKAIAAGLRFRSPGETAKDALAWWNAQPAEVRAKGAGIAAEREEELLRRWHKASG